MQGVWKFQKHDFFINELGDENYLIIGFGEYPWYRVSHGFWDPDKFEYHVVELMIMESSLERWEKLEV